MIGRREPIKVNCRYCGATIEKYRKNKFYRCYDCRMARMKERYHEKKRQKQKKVEDRTQYQKEWYLKNKKRVLHRIKMKRLEDILTIKKRRGTEYTDLINEFVKEINKERKNTAYKPATWFSVFKKVERMPKQDLYVLLSECRDYQNRHGSFSKRFYGHFKNNSFN